MLTPQVREYSITLTLSSWVENPGFGVSDEISVQCSRVPGDVDSIEFPASASVLLSLARNFRRGPSAPALSTVGGVHFRATGSVRKSACVQGCHVYLRCPHSHNHGCDAGRRELSSTEPRRSTQHGRPHGRSCSRCVDLT